MLVIEYKSSKVLLPSFQTSNTTEKIKECLAKKLYVHEMQFKILPLGAVSTVVYVELIFCKSKNTKKY
jgi:hypothetical protein